MKEQLKSKLAKAIRRYNRKGWSPATSTNYSFRLPNEDDRIFVSRSGVDKSEFKKSDFIEVDRKGQVLPDFEGVKPSAETGIHCVIYELFPATKCILHSHSVYPVLWSMELNQKIVFKGYELQKGFEGQSTHEGSIEIPILNNSQDMIEFGQWLTERKNEIQQHCFVIKGHGTYAWGESLFEAKRHLETLDYLCEVEWKRKKA